MSSNESKAGFIPQPPKDSKTFAKSGNLEFTKVQELVYELRVCDAMTRTIVTTTPETLMSELREILRSNRISGTPVMEGDRLVGVISIEDFIKWVAECEKDCAVKNKMSTDIKILYADEPLTHAVSKLEQTGFGRFPVVDRQNGKIVGIITKGDIIERLLKKLEIDYHEEEIHRHRASHIFEDIIADKVILTFQSYIKGNDFNQAGETSSRVKKTLESLGIHPQIVRRAAIASYEAEMNLVIYTDGGEITVAVQPKKIRIDVKDTGPGIADIQKAMEPGYSTASERVRELGFGAGMGLFNIKKCADEMDLKSKVGKGTHLTIGINIQNIKSQSKAE
ncbi:MAG: CBS domain-containing protein [Planctomycetota bacterium]|jgi:CBS domain-containing protein/anti-sigma regulatory factor (Ser/Thr protein kinase)